MSPLGQRMLNLLPPPNGVLNATAGQQWTSNDARDVTPLHVRKNTVIRIDTQLSDSQRFSIRTLFDRDDSTTFNRVAPGIGSVNNMFPGNLLTGTYTAVMSNTLVNEVIGGISQNHWGFRVGTGSLTFTDYTDFYRSSVGIDPPRLAPVRAAATRTSARSRRTSTRICRTCNMAVVTGPDWRSIGRAGAMDRCRGRTRTSASPSRTTCPGRRAALQVRVLRRARQQDRARLERLQRRLQLRSQRRQPAEHRQRLRQRAARRVHPLRRARLPRRRRGPPLAVGRVRAGQLAPVAAVHDGLRLARDPSRRRIRDARDELRVRSGPVAGQSGGSAVSSVLPAERRAGTQACAASNRAAINPINGNIVSQSFVGTVVPGSGDIATGSSRAASPARRAAGTTTCPRCRGRLDSACLGRHRRSEDRDPRLGRDLLQLHQPQPVSLQRRPARLAGAQRPQLDARRTGRRRPRREPGRESAAGQHPRRLRDSDARRAAGAG